MAVAPYNGMLTENFMFSVFVMSKTCKIKRRIIYNFCKNDWKNLVGPSFLKINGLKRAPKKVTESMKTAYLFIKTEQNKH